MHIPFAVHFDMNSISLAECSGNVSDVIIRVASFAPMVHNFVRQVGPIYSLRVIGTR
jgi:hypothetical protein